MNMYTKQNFSETAKDLTAKGYHWVAMLAETFIFVYLGMRAPPYKGSLTSRVICTLSTV